ncbi:MAG: hypothetical protein JXA30_21710 [Deltaproteobacteria bacterium]|nr:hypothetical protein [Deltaproteobacteria bacterium]
MLKTRKKKRESRDEYPVSSSAIESTEVFRDELDVAATEALYPRERFVVISFPT